MGTVWRAWDEELGRHVALKRLHMTPHLSEDERAVLYERTRREARAAAGIAHPHVVVVHDVVEDAGLPCIVMEYIPSRTLAEELKRNGPVPHGEAARIGLGMVAALRAAHAAGVLHRDVKPGNVLLGEDGRVVLTDFGIAVAAGASTLTKTGELVGSLDYLAPERLAGGTPGPASDLWALGATLYQAVEGVPPFRRDAPLNTAYAITTDPPPPPHRPGPLTALIEDLLAKAPEARPTTTETERRLGEAAPAGTGAPSSPEPTASPGAPGAAPLATDDGTLPGRPLRTATDSGDEPDAEPGHEPGHEPGPAASPGHEPGPRADPGRGAGAGRSPGPGPSPMATAGAGASTAQAPPGTTGTTGTPGEPAPGSTRPDLAPHGAPPAALHDGTAPRDPARPRRRRAAVWGAVLALVIAAAGGTAAGVYLWQERAGSEGTGSASGGRTSSSPSASPSGASPSPLPSGYHYAEEKEFGVSVPVPDGWTREKAGSGDEIVYVDPTGLAGLRVNVQDFASDDPLQDWKDDEARSREEGKLPGYRQLRMNRTEYRERPAAVWEFTWEGRKRDYRAINLGFGRPGGKKYVLYLSAPAKDWDRYRPVFDRVGDSFRITSG
ncbi:protein kinase domain-containing protein [Streptomyces zingiberis]|uniref:non-specific serine/threonine protein kinase n=2 Tax=Streptomyces zingiberis TaxID=2053010 RepID=A0ABX1BTY3_9ACTN|nr:protein kinase [Streptomyces zingiberis]